MTNQTELSLAAQQEAALAELDNTRAIDSHEAAKMFIGADPAKDDTTVIAMPMSPDNSILGAKIPQTHSLAVSEKKMPVASGGEIMAIVPRDVDEAWRLSAAFTNANMIPESYKGVTTQETQAKVMIGMLKGLEVGMPPVTALSTIMIVNNRPSIWGDGAMALVQRSGKMEFIHETMEGDKYTDNWTAVCEVKRVGQEPMKRTFCWAEAVKAGLVNKGPWKQYPGRMLQMRARAWALRDGFADALNGLAIYEEVRDYPAKDITPTDTSSLDDEPTTKEIKNDA